MTYKESLLIYRTQSTNVQKIWSAKKRIIKTLTPIIRSLTEQDFRAIHDYRTNARNLTQELELDITALGPNPNGLTSQEYKDSVADLKLAYVKNLNSLSNRFKNDKIQQLESNSKYLLLNYCTWSEAALTRLKHTPHGVDIMREQSYGRNIEERWANLVSVIIERIPNIYSGDITQMKVELNDISRQYIVENSFLRNKIAHGQWEYALNRDNDDLNIDRTLDICFLDPVKIDTAFEIHNGFTEILENMIESNVPEHLIIKKDNSYLFLKHQLDQLTLVRQGWNLETRAAFLKQRTFDTRNIDLANKLHLRGIEENVIFEITNVRIKRIA
jgi:hypothetical protein